MKFVKFLFALVLASCGKPAPHFTVSADLPQIGTQSLTVVYTTTDGNRHALPVTAVDGKFEFVGNSNVPALVEIYTSKRQLYAALLVKNDEQIALSGTSGDFIAEGSALAQLLLNYKEGDDTVGLPVEVRRAIESLYLSTALPAANFVSPEVFIKNDSVITFPPVGIWVFTSSDKERTTELIDTLRHYAKQKGVNVRDIFIGSDLWQWQTMIRRDSATWTQALSPDAPVTLKNILITTPLLIEVDTACTVIRTQSFLNR